MMYCICTPFSTAGVPYEKYPHFHEWCNDYMEATRDWDYIRHFNEISPGLTEKLGGSLSRICIKVYLYVQWPMRVNVTCVRASLIGWDYVCVAWGNKDKFAQIIAVQYVHNILATPAIFKSLMYLASLDIGIRKNRFKAVVIDSAVNDNMGPCSFWGHFIMVSANNRRRYICNVFCQWLRPMDFDHRKAFHFLAITVSTGDRMKTIIFIHLSHLSRLKTCPKLTNHNMLPKTLATPNMSVFGIAEWAWVGFIYVRVDLRIS